MPLIFFLGSGSPPTPRDVIEAVVQKWAATPSLTSVSPQLWFGERPPDPDAYPYAVLTQVASKSTFNTGQGYWEDKILQISVFDTDQDRLYDSHGPAVETAFDNTDLVFSNGYLMCFRRGGDEFLKVPKVGVGTPVVWHRCYQYKVQVGRTLP